MAASQAQGEVGLKERFYRSFQDEVAGELFVKVIIYGLLNKTALQGQIERLNTAYGPERNKAVDDCLAGIDRLSHEVKDASSYIPAYDQRTYSQVRLEALFCFGSSTDSNRQSRVSARSFKPFATLLTLQRSSRSSRARMLLLLQIRKSRSLLVRS